MKTTGTTPPRRDGGRRAYALPLLLATLALLAAGIAIGLAWAGRGDPPAPTYVEPPPTPGPTRDPAAAQAQEEAANRFIEAMRRASAGADVSRSFPPGSFAPGLIKGLIDGDSPARVVRLRTDPVAWTGYEDRTKAATETPTVVLTGRLTGTAALDYGDKSAPRPVQVASDITLQLQKLRGLPWQVTDAQLDPPMLPSSSPLPALIR